MGMKYIKLFDSFKEKESPLELIKSYLERNLNISLYRYNEIFHITKSDIKLDGYLYLSNKLLAIRINWIKDINNVHSIDIWFNFKFDIKPDYTIIVTNSIVSDLPKIVSFLKTKKINENINDQISDYESKLKRSRSDKKKEEYQSIIDKLRIELSSNEKVETDTTSEFKSIDIDPKMDVFTAIEYTTKQIAKGKSNSLLITGQSGIGKTHTVLEILQSMGLKEDVDYYRFSGDISTAGLYEILFLNRNKLLIFDDCDAIFDELDSINILAAALDTYKSRLISNVKRTYFDSTGMTDSEIQDRYLNENKLPKKFSFTGRVIFISNKSKDEFDKKFLTRTIHINVSLTKDELIDRMRSIVMKMMSEMPLYKKMEAFEYLVDLVSNKSKIDNLNIRSLIHSINLRCNEDNEDTIKISGESIPVWKMLIKQFVI